MREHVPTWLDRCDPWQPHQVLIRSLYELLRGALHPGRLLRKLDLNGRVRRAVLMLACGMAWLGGLAAAGLAAATVVHTGASPAAALRYVVLSWVPAVVAVAFTSAVLVWAMIAVIGIPRVPRAGWRQHLRLLGYWVPASAAWALVPLILGLLAVPDVVFEVGGAWPLLSGVPAIGAFARRPVRGRSRARGRLLAGLGLVAAWALGCVALAKWWLPKSLEPPWWVYF